MKKVSFVVDPFYYGNRIFDIADAALNRDNALVPFHNLKRTFGDAGYDLNTCDLSPIESADFVLCNEMDRSLCQKNVPAPKILILFETQVIRPDNWDVKLQGCFDLIFTWNDDFVDGRRYRKINFPQVLPDNLEKCARRSKDSFCAMVAGNKSSSHPLELYSERKRAITWFEQNHPEEFDLYGIGWDARTFSGPRLLRALNRFPFLRKITAERRTSYRGRISMKIEVLSRYKFAICYENVTGIPGYITEKLFDCLFAGCVPVYMGPPNINDYVPQSCYVRRESFPDYESLYAYLKAMREDERAERVEAGIRFVQGKGFKQFSEESFAQSLLAGIRELA